MYNYCAYTQSPPPPLGDNLNNEAKLINFNIINIKMQILSCMSETVSCLQKLLLLSIWLDYMSQCPLH